MANINDVAKKANVSKTTVSRVLNNHAYVSKELRSKVLKAIEELNYVPNQNAVTLSKGKTNLIGIVVSRMNHACYDEIVEGLVRKAQENGYYTLILYSNDEIAKEREFLDKLKTKEVDALVFISKGIEDDVLHHYASFGPIVHCQRHHIDNVSHVYPKRKESYEEIRAFFQRKGVLHPFICVEKDYKTSQSVREKTRVFQTECYEHLYSYEDGVRLAKEKIKGNSKKLGFFVDFNDVAVGIVDVATTLGYKLNHDLFIVSESDTLFAEKYGFCRVNYNLKSVGKHVFDAIFSDEICVQAVEYDFKIS
ncbi:LacI family DNA-binding transcriptional regulator [Erysipelothrix urinaevulpis]|uniref:LacI family DNA-binding transcriptional regulator n=1 Tax=Erysipelothrix urinaevulpis TaxID=2683717 RepID=UPI00135CCD51|nr:LacI family DNA-binding transcriptional regulator [Erysipelothrix urinaevulpis]